MAAETYSRFLEGPELIYSCRLGSHSLTLFQLKKRTNKLEPISETGLFGFSKKNKWLPELQRLFFFIQDLSLFLLLSHILLEKIPLAILIIDPTYKCSDVV